MYKIRRTFKASASSPSTIKKSRWQKYKDSLLVKGTRAEKMLEEKAMKERKRRLRHKNVLVDSAIKKDVKKTKQNPNNDWLHKIIIKTQVPPSLPLPASSATETITDDAIAADKMPEILQIGGYKPVVEDVMPDDTVVRTNAPLIIRHPTRIVVADASGSGKSTWIEKLLLHRQDCFDVPHKEIVWFYNLETAVKSHMDKLPGVQFHKVFVLSSKHMKSVIDQAQYIVHMKSAQDARQIQTLAGQIYGKHGNRFAMWAMNYAFGGSDHAYLVFDMHSKSKGWQRLRAQVFPGECNLLFVKKGTMLDKEFYEKNV
ncbi:hypothetical protein CAPTEDRAFT_187053 [Capitella teleta]|uniref:Uncharacterized protein n=1 Tax=Capitella teleta TaxID=283909 RepID=R7TFA8_CAPTE|nr:hypothetical protein CAPTEDRAFT_187053 [Capitella teleta]|eukprot:ELT92424.1 hypothetical protein CAPTEDRAFT_187053 [Capitella teleta]